MARIGQQVFDTLIQAGHGFGFLRLLGISTNGTKVKLNTIKVGILYIKNVFLDYKKKLNFHIQ